MSPTLLYRIAAVLLILFAAGHTVGFLSFRPPTAEGLAVRDAMHNVHFQVGKSSYSYGGFYDGFGLSATVAMLLEAFLAWHLAGLASTHPRAIGALGWVFFAQQLAGLVLSLIYFGPTPAVLSGLLVICLGWAAWRIR